MPIIRSHIVYPKIEPKVLEAANKPEKKKCSDGRYLCGRCKKRRDPEFKICYHCRSLVNRRRGCETK